MLDLIGGMLDLIGEMLDLVLHVGQGGQGTQEWAGVDMCVEKACV